MYYGYNDNKELILADEEFIHRLGFSSFDEVIQNHIPQSIRFDNRKLSIDLNDKIIEANYTESNLLTTVGPIKLVKLSNVIEISTAINNLQINYEPIYLDVEKISQSIGLSVDDYKLYLDSFIDQSIIDEKRLQEGNEMAIKNLSNLALTLQIPNISILLLKIKKLPKSERLPFVDEYYTRLALLTLKKPIHQEKTQEANAFDLLEEDTHNDDRSKEEELNNRFTELLETIEPNINAQKVEINNDLPLEMDHTKENIDHKDDLFNLDATLDDDEIFNLEQKLEEQEMTPVEPIKLNEESMGELTLEETRDEELTLKDLSTDEIEIKEEPQITPVASELKQLEIEEDSSEKINLDNATALPINYNPKVAADELNLPVVLIEEFVQDFIEQAHHDKDHLLASYYQKDMDNIHELGHKLKGAASNLRINELADVLEEIQFCKEHTDLEKLFIRFWGLFISLEDYMKQNAA